MKKLSELMLEGYSMVGQRQCVHSFYYGFSHMPDCVCAIGAAQLAEMGDAICTSENINSQLSAFFKRVGVFVSDLNDEGMSIPDIAGIAAAEGL